MVHLERKPKLSLVITPSTGCTVPTSNPSNSKFFSRFKNKSKSLPSPPPLTVLYSDAQSAYSKPLPTPTEESLEMLPKPSYSHSKSSSVSSYNSSRLRCSKDYRFSGRPSYSSNDSIRTSFTSSRISTLSSFSSSPSLSSPLCSPHEPVNNFKIFEFNGFALELDSFDSFKGLQKEIILGEVARESFESGVDVIDRGMRRFLKLQLVSL